MNNHYSTEELIRNYPNLRSQIEKGDFKIYFDESGKKVIEFTNTEIFAPNQFLIDSILSQEFPVEEISNLKYKSTSIGITISL